ncbi:nucleotide disphospho-sugar-binding domain-containing protein [Dactylosporangium sp. CA-092794]|uniref:nucleotide disphospho-sugar-binding domain-containing protein n=1 Tax=Dactylosporangium sp. CA-092794 TaxID=3239929 RepID=UPI003D8B0815
MRVLLTTIALYGHFFPMVPLAWALRCAGHEVLVAVPAADFADAVTAAGLPVAVTAGLSRQDYTSANGTGSVAEREAGLEASLAASGRGWARLAAETLDGMLDVVRAWRPDLVLSEPCEYAGRLAAARHRLPWVEQSWGLAAPPEFRAAAARQLAPQRLEPPAGTLHQCPRTLQHPDAPPGTYMRYIPYNGRSELPDWLAGAGGDRPLVCLTFGSVLPTAAAGPEKLIAGVVAQLSDLGVETVLGIDDALARTLRPALGDRVRHAGWMSLDMVLPHCAVAIHHGGTGSAMTSLVHRVPQLLLPQATDQFGTSQRFCATGVARRLLPDEVTGAAIRDAVVELLEKPDYREHSCALADELAAQQAPADVVTVLEQLARTGHR